MAQNYTPTNNLEIYKTSTLKGLINYLSVLSATMAAIYGSLYGGIFIYLLSQILLVICMFQCISILHTCGHNKQFNSQALNDMGGSLASFICLIPYFPWKKIHYQHHKWNGYPEKDPTSNTKTVNDLTPFTQNLINFCWKYWIPIFVVSFQVGTFYNLKKANKFAPTHLYKYLNALSILSIIILHGTLLVAFPIAYLRVMLISTTLFLIISDPYLLSQHCHMDLIAFKKGESKPLPLADQDDYTRTLLYPNWVSHYIFGNFNLHTLHHLRPGIPHYHMNKIEFKAKKEIWWTEWIRRSKSLRATELLFSGPSQTKQNF